jgi:hypothetical protein
MKGRKKGSITTEESAAIAARQRLTARKKLIQRVDELAAMGHAVRLGHSALHRLGGIPWLQIQYAGNGKHIFTINRQLRDICEWQTPPTNPDALSPLTFYKNLRAEIKRRREEADYERKRRLRWTPESVITIELCRLIDWIEDELDKIDQGQSANVRQDASTSHQVCKKVETNGSDENKLRTSSIDPGTGTTICDDATTSGGAIA